MAHAVRRAGRAARRLPLALVALLLVALVLRIFAMGAYEPMVLTMSDSTAYVWDAAGNAYADAVRPAGYSFFLRMRTPYKRRRAFHDRASAHLRVGQRSSALLDYEATRRVSLGVAHSGSGRCAFRRPGNARAHAALGGSVHASHLRRHVRSRSDARFPSARGVGSRGWSPGCGGDDGSHRRPHPRAVRRTLGMPGDPRSLAAQTDVRRGGARCRGSRTWHIRRLPESLRWHVEPEPHLRLGALLARCAVRRLSPIHSPGRHPLPLRDDAARCTARTGPLRLARRSGPAALRRSAERRRTAQRLCRGSGPAPAARLRACGGQGHDPLLRSCAGGSTDLPGARARSCSFSTGVLLATRSRSKRSSRATTSRSASGSLASGVRALTDYQELFRVHGILLLEFLALGVVGLFVTRGRQRRGLVLLLGTTAALLLLPAATTVYSARYTLACRGIWRRPHAAVIARGSLSSLCGTQQRRVSARPSGRKLKWPRQLANLRSGSLLSIGRCSTPSTRRRP